MPPYMEGGRVEGTPLKLLEIGLRGSTLSFLIVALVSIMGGNQQENFRYFGLPVLLAVEWFAIKPFRYFVISSVLMGAYNLIQLLRGIMRLRKKVSITHRHMVLLSLMDQVCSYIILSATSAMAGAMTANKLGFSSFRLPNLCDILQSFCHRISVAIVFAILATISSACNVALDVYIMFSH